MKLVKRVDGSVENGVFTFNESEASGKGNKSLITDETYTSFEIKFEWKVSKIRIVVLSGE